MKKKMLLYSFSQSEKIDSYESVLKKYDNIVNDKINLSERPAYWGGYSLPRITLNLGRSKCKN